MRVCVCVCVFGTKAKFDLTKQGLRGGRQGRWERWREQKTKTAEKKFGTIGWGEARTAATKEERDVQR